MSLRNTRLWVPALFALLSLLVAGSGTVWSAPAPTQGVGKRLVTKLLNAIAERNYAKFVEDGTPQVKAGMTKQVFNQVCDDISGSLKSGYTATRISKSVVQGYNVTQWRVVVKQGGNLIVTLSELGGKVGGFFYKPDTGQ